ncbi:MAG TPA: nitroreductase family protein [Myxococcales bacterium]|jgi:nitroreductase
MSAASATVIPFEASRRVSNLPVDPMFLDRWSPRAMSPEPIAERDVQTLFEAARWAPSGGNQQPWKFVYADSESALGRVRQVLVDGNRVWADKAPLLAVLLAHVNDEGERNDWAGFDSGAAWMSLALQARKLGLFAHAMGGFHEEKVYEVLGVDPKEWKPMVVIAVGRPGDAAVLPPKLQTRERPSERRPLAEAAIRIEG